jgi:WD40 repeat protein
MGVVYQARHVGLNRLVALKMILAGGHAGPDDLARFRGEAEAVARLKHPNVVQIYDVGEAGGLPYFSLELVEGGGLDKKLAGTPLPPNEAAALIETLARAMAAAHTAGLVHRDLKPANILLRTEVKGLRTEAKKLSRQSSVLSTEEVLSPVISDFGLAKKLDAAGLTASGAVVGTPSYMAPEQAGGRSKEIGPACDIYALGAVLYECLTGRPPFRAATVLDTILQVVSEEPVPPRQLNARVPVDVETICLKCLQKEPGRRYASAAALADDLRRFLDGRPILARPVGRLERGAKWVRRNPAVAALLTAVVLAVAGGVTGIYLNYLDARAQQGIAEANARAKDDEAQAKEKALAKVREEAEARKKALDDARDKNRKMQEQLANNAILLAQAAWEHNDPGEAIAQLERVPTDPPLRRWEWHYLRRRYEGGIFTLRGHSAAVVCVAYSPDGARLATGSWDHTARVWDARSGQLLREFKGHKGGVYAVRFSTEGASLATASADGTARVWDVRTGKQLSEVNMDGVGAVTAMAYTPDGTRLATGTSEGKAWVWDARTGKRFFELKTGDAAQVTGVAYSPDGTRLATSGVVGKAQVWDARTGKRLLEVKTQDVGGFTAVAYSPDGTRLATGSLFRKARVWDAHTGRLLLELPKLPEAAPEGLGGVGGAGRPPDGLAFSPDGARLAATSKPDILSQVDAWAVTVWDARSGSALLELKGHTSQVYGLAFSPDGARVATAGQDATARVWDVRTGTPGLRLKGQAADVPSAAFNRDGRHLVTGSWDQAAHVWDARTGRLIHELKGHTGAVRNVAYSPDGARLAAAGEDGTVCVWGGRTGKLLRQLKGRKGWVSAMALSPDGVRLAISGLDLTARVWYAEIWHADTGELLLELKLDFPGGVSAFAFSPDGTRLVTAGTGKGAQVWDARNGREILNLEGRGLSSVAFSPDGTRLAAAGDRTGGVWDARTGQLLVELHGHIGFVHDGTFSPDGTRLATALRDGALRIWDARTGNFLLELKVHTSGVLDITFSPDGTRLASAVREPTVRIWDGRPLSSDDRADREWATRPDPDWHAAEAERLAEAGQWFAAAFHDGRLRLVQPGGADLYRLALCQAAARLSAARATGTELLGHVTRGSQPRAIAALLAAAPGGLPAVVGASAQIPLERAAHIRAGLLRAGRLDNPERPLGLVAPRDAVTRAAILTRAGRCKEAVGLLAGRGEPAALLYLALAAHGCGKRGEARQALAQAVRRLDAPGAAEKLPWPERAEAATLRAEAEALLGGKKP